MSRLCTLLIACAATLPAAPSFDDLYRLIRNDDAAGLKAALANGADVNTKDTRGGTLLMHAAIAGNPEMMKLLIDAGADVNAKNSFGATALVWSAGDIRKVRLLVEKGAEVNVVTKQGRTPLLSAAQHDGGEEAVRLLLAKGADVKTKDGIQNTALHSAAQSNDIGIVRLLLEKGLDANARNQFGGTPLMSAASQGNLAMVKLLLEKGADVNAVSEAGGQKVKNGAIALGKFTPLLLAVAYGSPELVKTLLDAGAEVNVQDVRGMTPLMLAVSSETQNPEVVRLLLKKSADPAVKSLSGETALDWAKKFGNRSVLKLLHGEPSTASASARSAASMDLRTPVAKSIALLQRSSNEFFKQSGCVGCHHQNITAMAVRNVRGKGIAVDEASAAEQMKSTKFQWAGFQELLLQRIDAPGGADMVDYSVIGLAAANYPPDPITDAMVSNVAASQQRDGSWHIGGVSRAPIEESDVSRTALSLHALQLYGSAGRKAEFTERIDRARAWLAAAKPKNTEERNMQLLGLKWAKADSAAITRLSKALLSQQRSDGGWGQNPNLSSDAYATGESLFVLHHAVGRSPKDAAYQRGVGYLLSTQLEDGSWHVKSRAPKFQPYFQSGFPHDHDQWISATATGWAAMALSAAIEPEQSAALK
jgi:ankyrin repeat protein